MYKIQVDNHVSRSFPVALHVTPLPHSVAVASEPKPFIEATYVKRVNDNHNFQHIQFLKVTFYIPTRILLFLITQLLRFRVLNSLNQFFFSAAHEFTGMLVPHEFTYGVFSCRKQLLHSGFLSACRPELFFILHSLFRNR